MKFKFVASKRDVIIFLIFALFLLYVIALGVLNIPLLASEGTFYGLNPIEAFTGNYLYYTLLFYFISLAGLILSVNSYFFEFQEGLGLNISGKSSGGYSSWAKAKEIKEDKNIQKVNTTDDKSEYAGVPLISNGKELWVDNGEYHTLVIGSTGSGKTQCTILPAMKSLAKKRESIIVTDPKAEIYEKTGGLLKKNGYNIILLNFRNPQNGNAWNPLELPYKLYKSGNQDKAIELLDDLALNILYDESNANQDPFWEKTAADYFSGIALAMFEDTTEDKININSINMTATVGEDKFGGSTYIKEYFSYKEPNSAAYVNASGTVMAPSDTKGGIISVFKQKVKLFASRENLSEMLSHSDFTLDSIGKQPTAVFIIIQDEKRTYHPLATIFIKQAYETLIDVAQENGGKLPVRTNFLLDEFANMPPLKDVTTMITAARSRQIRFTLIIQNFAQLNKVYGKDDAETIKGNCGNIIYLISTELAALEEISKLCGEKKSKKDDKTASTPLATVSDLQRMKQFDQILLRLRRNPFKTSFVPDFKIDWGNCTSSKVGYPTREKQKVEVFDIREFVKEKKAQKMNEVMASMDSRQGSPMGFPFMSDQTSQASSGGSSRRPIFPQSRSQEPDISVSDIVKKIDEKLAELEKEEKMAKEQQKNKEEKIDSSVITNEINKTNKEEELPEKKPMSIAEYNKANTNIELLDEDDFILDDIDIEKKVNDKLSNIYLDELDEKDKKENINTSYNVKKEQQNDMEKEPIDAVYEELDNEETSKQPKELKPIDYEPYKENEEDKKMIEMIEKEVSEYKEEKEKNNMFKPTTTIKLEDAMEDDEFFDNFFDD